MSNFMAFGIVIIQSCQCTLGFPKSTKETIGGRWIRAWERLVTALVSDCSPLKPARDDTEHTSDAVTSPSMSDSPNIGESTSPVPHSKAGEVQVRITSTSLDAGCGSASSSNASHKHQAAVPLSPPEISTTLRPHPCINDMIGDPEVNLPDCVPKNPFVDSQLVCEEDAKSVGFLPPVCSCLVCEEDKENDVLLDLRMDGRNIVLDSMCPHIAPHIVITPPMSYTDDFYTSSNNRVDIQWPYFLDVPRLSPHIFSHHCPLPTPRDQSTDCGLERFESQTVAPVDESGGIRPETPSRVFNRQKLLATVEASSTERLIFREVADGIFRHRRKAVAFEASLSAPAACARFNEPGAASYLEQPFVWTDPAQPILQSARYFSGNSILESDCPFRAPHIMITDAPPHDPWISWSNRVEEQDYDCLPVYPKRNSSSPPNSMPLDAASAPGLQLHHERRGIQSQSNYSREPYLMDTPLSLDEPGSFLMDTPHEICEWGCAHGSDYPYHTSSGDASLEDNLSFIRCETPTPDCDDEDDLPPFDDWYLSVIERSKVVGA